MYNFRKSSFSLVVRPFTPKPQPPQLVVGPLAEELFFAASLSAIYLIAITFTEWLLNKMVAQNPMRTHMPDISNDVKA